MSRGIQIISVIGGREPTPAEEDVALEVGRELAINKIIGDNSYDNQFDAACSDAISTDQTTCEENDNIWDHIYNSNWKEYTFNHMEDFSHIRLELKYYY